MNKGANRETRYVEEIKRKGQYVDRGEGKLPQEIKIEI
jgi:hypothetical protein